ncbi:hypothetical protein Pmar_PMAR021004 [Perkinsus marinus ATCC 50983]|uniref:Uncharacterized protein n=1 Tax=Perkinsus marinus (strain ATCC 50983 / TXsc) TaxID=423536 RepID=C5KG52_PERM5|nr:hypothetical protein Pmar_PMAR021004 [Perkinsus marinus ATCC 50983]EER16408.1 hypothetical protein Pmar_PMAR021004 [Perkinsus marinus ATCC 50983]|eukprot:XP_002784612.1 hypothetical protein Pmar_PMAR021004 [Perkinsus marinus ATCC 50983]
MVYTTPCRTGLGFDIVALLTFGKLAMTMKIAVLGPRRSGKTTIANILGEVPIIHLEGAGGEAKYAPTCGVRILDIETDEGVAVELWDVSGDVGDFDACYRTVQHGCDGVILVYDPNERAQVKEVDNMCCNYCNGEFVGDRIFIIIVVVVIAYRKYVQKHFVTDDDGMGLEQCMVLQTPRLNSSDEQMKTLQAVPTSMEKIGTITSIARVEEMEPDKLLHFDVGGFSERDAQAAATVNPTLPLKALDSPTSSIPSPVAPHTMVLEAGSSVPTKQVLTLDEELLPPSAPSCRMVRVKLTKTIPGDKFGFVNQAPLLGAGVTGGPTCLEIVTIVKGQLLDKWNKIHAGESRVTEGSYITMVNGVKLDLKEMREALKTDSVDMEVYVPIQT